MAFEPKSFSPKQKPKGLSEDAISIHHDTLYAGYVKKANAIGDALAEFVSGVRSLDGSNPTYSDLRGIKESETFARNGMYLHEWYFDVLGGSGEPIGELADALAQQYGSLETFLAYFKANGMVARGWAVLCWDTKAAKLQVYTGDAHNQGGVWGAIPIIVLDVYEHAYFMDYGSKRGEYIDDFLASVDWERATELYTHAKQITIS